jgi:hypothetical protein
MPAQTRRLTAALGVSHTSRKHIGFPILGTVYFSAGYTGGGGGGGLLEGSIAAAVGTYAVTIGAGGVSANGGDTVFGSHTAKGGGYATGLYQGAGRGRWLGRWRLLYRQRIALQRRRGYANQFGAADRLRLCRRRGLGH